MRTLGNILWHFPFFGFVNAIVVYLFGLILTATVVAAPIGLGLMRFGKFLFAPLMLVTGLLILANGCGSPGSDSQVPRQAAVDQAVARAAFQAQAPSMSAGDAAAIACIVDLPARWNRSAAPLVRDYLDPNVPADRWVKEASIHIGELRAVQVEMQACTFAIQDPGIKRTFQEIAANYRTKLDWITALHNAVAQGDQQAEQGAQQALSYASAEGQRLGQALLERLRPYVDPQVLTDELRKKGKEIGDLMRPR